jgi:DNA-binding transcriptional regulator YiaG
MPNLAAVLKAEIFRLSRRALRPLYIPIKKDVAALKRALAEHKRFLTRLAKDNARLVADLKARLATPPSLSEKELKGARIGPKMVLSQRKRLGLSRVAFAKLLGVSGGAVVAWEGGRSKPRAAAKAALVAIRKLGKREARQRLAALAGSNGNGRAPARGHRKGRKTTVRTPPKR